MLLRRLSEQGIVPPGCEALESAPVGDTAGKEAAALAWASAVLGSDVTGGSRDWTWSWLL